MIRRPGALGAALVALVFASSAFADDKPAGDPPTDAQKKEAQSLFAQGMKLAEAGDQKGALASFRAAYGTIPSYRVLYNIAQLCARLGDPACAVRAYERYLRDGPDAPPKRIREVENELKTLTGRVAMVTVTANMEGADVSVDDVAVGRAPLPGPVAVNPGAHVIMIGRDGKTADRPVKVAAGERLAVDLELTKDAPPPPKATTPEPAPATPPAPARGAPVVPWAVTGGFALGTLVSGILAATAYSDFNDAKEKFPVTKAELDDAQGSARTLLFVTGAFGALTIASAAVAGYFTFLARPPTKRTGWASVGLVARPGTVGIGAVFR